jgi:redox-sensitive bicupin YhaK (pirin superfamily)
MTAGRGIVHSEMPATDGVQKGLQLWINLPAKDKMYAPPHQANHKQSYYSHDE